MQAKQQQFCRMLMVFFTKSQRTSNLQLHSSVGKLTEG